MGKHPFGETLTRAFEASEWTSQEALAAAVGYSQPYLSQVMAGDRRPSKKLARSLAEKLHANVHEWVLLAGHGSHEDVASPSRPHLADVLAQLPSDARPGPDDRELAEEGERLNVLPPSAYTVAFWLGPARVRTRTLGAVATLIDQELAAKAAATPPRLDVTRPVPATFDGRSYEERQAEARERRRAERESKESTSRYRADERGRRVIDVAAGEYEDMPVPVDPDHREADHGANEPFREE